MPAPKEADEMARDNDELPHQIRLDLSGPAADNDGPMGDVTYLNMPWGKASASIQTKALRSSEINTYDGGRLALVMASGLCLRAAIRAMLMWCARRYGRRTRLAFQVPFRYYRPP
ncbi:hypothetical protein CK226_10040 [Mesorhizobium sp. WSM4311]|nr:hypothetical protein CK226_10040 [Mesorhizobium sp. WSM4311]